MVLLTGKQPREFFDANANQWQWQRYTKVGDSLANIINKMSAENHRDRYQSAKEVLRELPSPLQPQPNPDRTKIPIFALLGTAAIALAGGLPFFLLSVRLLFIGNSYSCPTLNDSEIRFGAGSIYPAAKMGNLSL